MPSWEIGILDPIYDTSIVSVGFQKVPPHTLACSISLFGIVSLPALDF